jgi:hypothetical protein
VLLHNSAAVLYLLVVNVLMYAVYANTNLVATYIQFHALIPVLLQIAVVMAVDTVLLKVSFIGILKVNVLLLLVDKTVV